MSTQTIPKDGESRTLSVTVPAGVKIGSRLRMKGEGEPSGSGRGDLYLVVEVLPQDAGDELVKVNVEIPRNPSPRQKELVVGVAMTLEG